MEDLSPRARKMVGKCIKNKKGVNFRLKAGKIKPHDQKDSTNNKDDLASLSRP